MKEITHSYLSHLNDVQRAAVEAIDGPVMVIAGPGSGKTRVLTYRIAHLVRVGIPPWKILALTFTNKAAREMKERIEELIGSGTQRIWAGTFHSLFARILRVEAHKLGYPNDFTIYDTEDSKSLIRQIVKQKNLDKNSYNPGAVLSRISTAKSNLITPKAYASNNDLLEYDKMSKRPMLHQVYEKYVAKCKRAGAMDFDDLLLQMFKLLYQNPDGVKEKYQHQFEYILVDEFQDTNFLQYEILKQFIRFKNSPNNITIVGDDAQSIYSFRGATIENILQFEKDFPHVQTYKLEQNYRSTHHIVNAANHVIEYNQKQIKKKIWTENVGENKIKIIKAISDSEEGKRITDLIVEQKNRFNLENREIAILYRTNAQSRVFEEHLRRQNILYRIYGGLSFYQRKEVKDLLAYLRLTVNPRDDEAFKRVVNYPRRGIGQTTINKLIQFADDNEISLWQSVPLIEISARARNLLAQFAAQIQRFRIKANESDAYMVAGAVAKQAGIIDVLKSDNSIEGFNRLENVNALLDGIKEFVEDDEYVEGETLMDKSLAKYLQSIALITDMDQDNKENNVITLMSVHAAKGLEFLSIFLVGLEENLFPSYMSLSSPDQIDEERRLFYVAITRAKKHLTLSYSNSRYQFGQMRFNDPSRFLEEIPPEHVESVIPIRQKPEFPSPRILGNFKPVGARKERGIKINRANFNASSSGDIQEGMYVLHLKFGKGKVVKIDERRIATIHFNELVENATKRIMLQYTKLQILNS